MSVGLLPFQNPLFHRFNLFGGQVLSSRQRQVFAINCLSHEREPEECFFVVLFYAIAIFIHQADSNLRTPFALFKALCSHLKASALSSFKYIMPRSRCAIA